MWIIYDKDTFDKLAMEALKRCFPDDEVIDEHFNHNYQVVFKDGKYGYAGTSNGHLECDLYKNIDDMVEGNQPFNSITISKVIYDRKIWVNEIFYPALVDYTKTDLDRIEIESAMSMIGWVNCLQAYDITPNIADMKEMVEFLTVVIDKDPEDDYVVIITDRHAIPLIFNATGHDATRLTIDGFGYWSISHDGHNYQAEEFTFADDQFIQFESITFFWYDWLRDICETKGLDSETFRFEVFVTSSDKKIPIDQ